LIYCWKKEKQSQESVQYQPVTESAACQLVLVQSEVNHFTKFQAIYGLAAPDRLGFLRNFAGQIQKEKNYGRFINPENYCLGERSDDQTDRRKNHQQE
jgi:hypothetical protein